MPEDPRQPLDRPARAMLVQHASGFSGSTMSGLLVARGMRRAGWDVAVCFGADGPALAAYRDLGCDVRVVPHRNWLRGGNVVQSVRRVAAEYAAANDFVRLIQTIRPDVLYVNSLVSLAAAIAARRAGVPCVWHLRELFNDLGGEMTSPALGGKPLVRRMINRLADLTIVPSPIVATNLLGTAAAAHTAVVPNAVDENFFMCSDDPAACRQRLGLPQGVPIIGIPGTLRPVKGHPFFFDAFAQIAGMHGDCHVAISGDGDAAYVATLRGRVEELGLASRVHFLGTVALMSAFYRACDVICVPSRSESFGRTVVEAFAVGTPVVATAVGGMAELIRDGATGLLVGYGDVASLALALETLLEREELRRQLVHAARAEANAKYRAEQYESRILELVQSVLVLSTVPAGAAAVASPSATVAAC